MKKGIGFFIGLITTIIGLVMTIMARIQISSHSRYTWRPPYTQFEADVLTTQWFGIALLIIGILVLFILIVSSIYQSKNIKDISGNMGFKNCPFCNCKITLNTKVCPM